MLAEPLTPFDDAVIIAVPGPALLERPAVLTVATVVSLELQVAVLVRSSVLLSL